MWIYTKKGKIQQTQQGSNGKKMIVEKEKKRKEKISCNQISFKPAIYIKWNLQNKVKTKLMYPPHLINLND